MNDERRKWIALRDRWPKIGSRIEILHFGGLPPKHQITDTATVDPRWGGIIVPENADGGHGKPSTITHWRPIDE